MARPLPIRPFSDTAFPNAAFHVNTASVGIPPLAAVAALHRYADNMTRGVCDTATYAVHVERCRAAFGSLVGVRSRDVAIAGTVSHVVGMAAASLPAGSRVLCVEDDFTSVTGPFLSDPRLRVTLVPFEALLESIRPGIDLVAVSAVRSNDGRVLDLSALAAASQAVGALTVVDATHGTGWLTIDAKPFDIVVSAGYKWLLTPRGISFAAINPSATWLRPIYANWSGTDDPWNSLYGPSLRLSADARRFDSSPPWPLLEAAAISLETVASAQGLGEWSVGLANAFRAELGLAASNSPIISLPGDPAPLADAGVAVAARAGRVRLSFYGYNDEVAVERAARAVRESSMALAS
ncbi:aminotransferase class V-fold PLP-dependent enzyme [Demequina sp.]|uniref:aminotransferase class V-fold PLP-dependent enzyme n=1 Tax=Demequina sp. TaxID=2050685 RepID=UPI003D1320D8